MHSNIAQEHASAPRVSTFAQGIFDSLPIVIGYLPVAFAFGLSAVKLGFSPAESLLFSILIYAGASQFVITALLSAGMSLWVSALTVMAMDVRHILYGPSLRSRLGKKINGPKTAIWAFGLTDEVFAAATTKLIRDQRSWSAEWMCGLALSSWIAWVIGTGVGTLFANGPLEAYPAIEASLSFMLPALFLSFLLAAFKRQHSLVFIASLTGALAGLIFYSIPVAILCGIGGGCLASLRKPSPSTLTRNVTDEQ
ncbi:AzlC family ABC transporter permease [Rahnella sp. SAP-1]|jgi:4-azaleucine resistance transporter AzlC|uniref:AzlC family ABC transporter permease n=1 Tax=Rouxiella aceris TaxID=2703884 RepID=A0A848MEY7_9GAMM|nr:AzlC family ABC transporter permease [Rouxiella aceris]NMP25966.1 AzlC family ABC transporter permease [Rouxiella aceris]